MSGWAEKNIFGRVPNLTYQGLRQSLSRGLREPKKNDMLPCARWGAQTRDGFSETIRCTHYRIGRERRLGGERSDRAWHGGLSTRGGAAAHPRSRFHRA